ncbi:putative RING/U-box protein [Quillaja saponaria]|uniref:RING/U-box protein n=1 Tax=Quillaja saponaria TaxID=32244 RepID=A0AAD7M0L6_QUISA|nr:putative RING/U-box protein [Quillaja saponaria]
MAFDFVEAVEQTPYVQRTKGSVQRERETTTLLGLLREQMDGVDTERRRRSLKERLGFKGMGCCGATWGFRPATIGVRHDEDEEEEQPPAEETNPGQTSNIPDPECVSPIPAASGMNLAAALAAERQFRASHEPDGSNETVPGTPLRVSLMRLLEETDGGDDGQRTETDKGGGGGVLGNDTMCCVCMVRKKGAAFIPCGHTFCRVCSRELWLNRGSCPLCNRSILRDSGHILKFTSLVNWDSGTVTDCFHWTVMIDLPFETGKFIFKFHARLANRKQEPGLYLFSTIVYVVLLPNNQCQR